MDQANAPGRKSGARRSSAQSPSEAATGETGAATGPRGADATNLNGMSFEQAVTELESLVTRLESPDLPLSEALASYQRGSALMRHAQGLLDQVQSQIEIIESGQVRSVDRASLISQIKE